VSAVVGTGDWRREVGEHPASKVAAASSLMTVRGRTAKQGRRGLVMVMPPLYVDAGERLGEVVCGADDGLNFCPWHY